MNLLGLGIPSLRLLQRLLILYWLLELWLGKGRLWLRLWLQLLLNLDLPRGDLLLRLLLLNDLGHLLLWLNVLLLLGRRWKKLKVLIEKRCRMIRLLLLLCTGCRRGHCRV
jgi:hypothetical protein